MKRLMPTTYFLYAIVCVVMFHLLIPGKTVYTFPVTFIGLMPIATGIAFNLLADTAMKRHNTAVRPFDLSTALVDDGVFRVTRNPMYVGMVMILLGIVVLLGTLTPWIAVVAYALILQVVFISAEERKLIDAFGDQYREYQKHVRQWL